MADDVVARDQRRGELAGVSITSESGAASLTPANLRDAMDFAAMMAASTFGVRADFRDQKGACLAVALQAWRWGMDPFAVASKAYKVNDQIAYEAQLVVALVNTRAPIRGRLVPSYQGEGGGRTCIVSAVDAESGEVLEYQTPPLSKIKARSPLWDKDPDQQLFYYAGRAFVRRYYPEVLLGVYTIDETAPARDPYFARDITPAEPGDAPLPSIEEMLVDEAPDIATLIENAQTHDELEQLQTDHPDAPADLFIARAQALTAGVAE